MTIEDCHPHRWCSLNVTKKSFSRKPNPHSWFLSATNHWCTQPFKRNVCPDEYFSNSCTTVFIKYLFYSIPLEINVIFKSQEFLTGKKTLTHLFWEITTSLFAMLAHALQIVPCKNTSPYCLLWEIWFKVSPLAESYFYIYPH